MEQQTYIVSFEEVTPTEVSLNADELSNALLDASADITIQRVGNICGKQSRGCPLK